MAAVPCSEEVGITCPIDQQQLMAVEPRDEAAPQNHPDPDSFPKPTAQELQRGFNSKDSSAQAVSDLTDPSY